jgi:hypothetical protein
MANKNDNLPEAATVMKSKSFSSSNMNKHMKIVVIGGSGLIGTKLVNNLRQHSHEVEVNDQSLVPGDNPRLGPTRFEDWLSQSIPQK